MMFGKAKSRFIRFVVPRDVVNDLLHNAEMLLTHNDPTIRQLAKLIIAVFNATR
jgi:hypothetical protein